MATLNLMNIPQSVKDTIEREYPCCTDSKALAASLGVSLAKLQNIAHAMHVPKSMAVRSRVASISATMNRSNAFGRKAFILE